MHVLFNLTPFTNNSSQVTHFFFIWQNFFLIGEKPQILSSVTLYRILPEKNYLIHSLAFTGKSPIACKYCFPITSPMYCLKR